MTINQRHDGGLVKLFQALKGHGKLQALDMTNISMCMDDVAALADLVQPSSSLRKLVVGKTLSCRCKKLVRTVLSLSSEYMSLNIF